MVTENLHRAKQCTPGCVCVISHVFQILLEQGECINVLGSYIDSWSPNGGQHHSYQRGRGDQGKWALLGNGELHFGVQPQASC